MLDAQLSPSTSCDTNRPLEDDGCGTVGVLGEVTRKVTSIVTTQDGDGNAPEHRESVSRIVTNPLYSLAANPPGLTLTTRTAGKAPERGDTSSHPLGLVVTCAAKPDNPVMVTLRGAMEDDVNVKPPGDTLIPNNGRNGTSARTRRGSSFTDVSSWKVIVVDPSCRIQGCDIDGQTGVRLSAYSRTSPGPKCGRSLSWVARVGRDTAEWNREMLSDFRTLVTKPRRRRNLRLWPVPIRTHILGGGLDRRT